jgi:hypothetical protein
MPSSPLERLKHIRDECAYLSQPASSLTREEFFASEDLKRAFVWWCGLRDRPANNSRRYSSAVLKVKALLDAPT